VVEGRGAGELLATERGRRKRSLREIADTKHRVSAPARVPAPHRRPKFSAGVETGAKPNGSDNLSFKSSNFLQNSAQFDVNVENEEL